MRLGVKGLRECGIQGVDPQLKEPSLCTMSSASLSESHRCPAVCVRTWPGFKTHTPTQFALTQHLLKDMEEEEGSCQPAP